MEIKPIVIPEKPIEKAKFIQVYLLNNNVREPVLRNYDRWCGYHSDLLEGILKEIDIKPEMIKSREGYFIVKPQTDRYELYGAGRLEFKDGIFTFWSFSVDYSSPDALLGPNQKHFKDIQVRVPEFKFKIDTSRRD